MEDLSGTKVLVTGASGFIGSHLVKRLLKENADVHIILRKSSDLNRRSEVENKIMINYGNITDYNFVRETINTLKPKKIFHLAGYLKRDTALESLKINIKINFFGTLNILKSLQGENIERFIFISTSEGYIPGKPPFREEQRRSPVSSYSASKICAENLCELFSNTYKIPVVILRPFQVYGSGQGRGMIIPDMILSLLNDIPIKITKGEQTRDFIHIDDVVESLILAAVKKGAIGQTFNVCSGVEYKVKDLALKISNLVGGELKPIIGGLPYRKNEIWRYFGDNTRIRKKLGWKPVVPIEEGLKKTVGWYRENKKSFS